MIKSGTKDFFWLHIKKSAGESTRATLSPMYKTVDQNDKPECFIQADPSEYNDILNNYRSLLGEYQFRRALFAKKFLYPTHWNEMVKFSFSREPVSRCVSAFFMLYAGTSKKARKLGWKHFKQYHSISLSLSGAFDHFLDMIAETRQSSSYLRPYGQHFATHTAAMWDDVTDEKGHILLDYIFRLEDFRTGINLVLEECGYPHLRKEDFVHTNRGKHPDFLPDRQQRRKIETLYSRDFEIYERKTYTKKV